ncbi:hypothetical protein DQ04_04091070 [Trypanosoma grayi]|uniref:hypothetical protein n=1 Tax=Trypanosoma grayi TaxID=71804 RepID=UPI0004F44D55|nr:hypothetical protein DQ04_04091070 [Trypanosoma grayi]KEG10173.1 hypothetical protein DQ04_04091070 [Trypanosoma grayi]
MQEATHHLLDGVVGLTCVDPSIHPSISAAPLVVSIITQQCLYACHAASACQALLNEGGSSFWYIMRRVAEARERYTAVHAPPPPPPIPSRRAELGGEVQPRASTTTFDSSINPPPCRAPPPTCLPPEQEKLLSPLEFRVVVVGGGRVGRAIVERLLQVPELIHPSRITIITRQPVTVAQFAGRGVQCTNRGDGRQALLDCHVLVVACQQTQFHDFASIYCPHRNPTKGAPVGTQACIDNQQQQQQQQALLDMPRRRRRKCRHKKRTLRDVVDKWRTTEDDDDYRNSTSSAPITRLLKPSTIVFSCCAALGTHKIAKELGHLDPLVVRADVDLTAIHHAARQFDAAKEAFRAAYIKGIALESNSFLTTLNVLQQSCMNGETPPLELTSEPTDSLFNGDMHSTHHHQQRQQRHRPLPPPDMQTTLRGEGVSGSTAFLLQVWRALRCCVVVRVVSLTPAEHRLFTYLQRVGPLLGAVLVALPESSQQRIIAMVREFIYRAGEDENENEKETGVTGARRLIKLDKRCVSACDSDADEDDDVERHDDDGDDDETSDNDDDGNSGGAAAAVSPAQRELKRLVSCFPELFHGTEEALQQLRERYNTVTQQGLP